MARLPSTLTTLIRSASTPEDVKKILRTEGASIVVVGLPRGLNGQHTAQTESVQAFGRELEEVLGMAVKWQDEAVTSRKAEAELESRGKPYQKGDIDALSAVYILEDFLRDHPEVT
jgi:putative Holliday junction resolvase